jgi:tetratricopeptide (TPR) repeat protein
VQAYTLGEQILVLVQQHQDRIDRDLFIESQYVMGAAAHWQGHYLQARDHFAQAMAIDAIKRSKTHIALYAQDPGVVCRIRLSFVLWCLGYPDQAQQLAEATVVIARQLAYPLTLAYALMFAAYASIGQRNDSIASVLADEVVALSRTYDMPYFLYVGLAFQGHLLAQHGETEAGIAQLRASISGQQSLQAYNHLPQSMFMLAQAYLRADQIDQAQAAVDEGLAAIMHHGDHHYVAEYYRLKGELLDKGRAVPSIVEACFQQAYTIAHDQHAKSLELRAAIRLSRFWQAHGKCEQARLLLCESYSWFTEGFDTPDLKEANALLAELS